MIRKDYSGILPKLVTIIAVSGAVYHVLYIAHVFQYLGIYMLLETHRAFHIAFVLALTYLLYPLLKGASRNRPGWHDGALAFIAVILPLYVGFSPQSQFFRWQAGRVTDIEVILAVIGIVLLLEAARRLLGIAVPLLAASFFLYAMYGNYVPGFLQHKGFSLTSVIETVVFSNMGIFGFITGISSTIIIMFIFFGSFLLASGGGEFFIKLASALTGRYRGGAAKVAIVASMFFGMISGSTSANVATTGVITIPLMKSIGYRPEFAGAVEAVASNGGQVMPPVMGAVAFVMAEWLGIPYWSIVLAAGIPALLYYVALYIFIDIEALRLQLRGSASTESISVKKTLSEGWVYLVPVAVLLYFLMWLRYSPESSALYSIGAIVVASMFRKETRMGWRKLVTAIRSGMTVMPMAAVACISAGVIISTIMMTGLGPKLTGAIVAASGGGLFPILVLVAIMCFILGMGLGTLAIYLLVVTLVAPALTAVGVPPLASHMFVFWWGLTSFITPPVCVAVFIACAIAGSPVWKTGLAAMRMGMLTYILPFVWVYNPALLLIGSPAEIISTTLITLVMLVMLGYGLAGFMLKWWQRVLLVGGVSLVLTFSWLYVVTGVGIGLLVFLLYWWPRRRHAYLASKMRDLGG